MRNIINFKRDYTEAVVVKLEQNYRSTKCIIDAANCVVKNNKTALEKTLWTDNECGEKIVFIEAPDDKLEASIIAKIIEEKMKESIVIPAKTGIYKNGQDNLIDPRVKHEDDNIATSLELQINKYSDNLILYRTN